MEIQTGRLNTSYCMRVSFPHETHSVLVSKARSIHWFPVMYGSHTSRRDTDQYISDLWNPQCHIYQCHNLHRCYVGQC
jgi:hypothetical protein